MPANALFDLTELEGGVSISPGTNSDASGDVDGSYVDCTGIQGPVHAEICCGAATGSPTAFSFNFEIWEADDSSGTNAQVCENQIEVTLTADDTRGVGQAHLTKPFARVRCLDADNSFTGGSSPTLDLGANILFSPTRP
jgi:hypothetical protein